MTEPTATSTPTTPQMLITNPNRPPLFTLLKTVGAIKKGTRVTPVDEGQVVRGRLVYQVVPAADLTRENATSTPVPGTPVPAEAMERSFRTADERELGRDFSDAEARAHEQRWELRFAVMAEERSRSEIAAAIEQMATRLERAAEDLRRELSSKADPAQQAERAQHAMAWLFPNLGADGLTRRAIEWSMSRDKVTRLLTEGLQPAGIAPA
jgi:hypothetical protein